MDNYNDAFYYNMRGDDLKYQNNFQLALIKYTRALKLNPNRNIYNDIAHTFLKMKKFERADSAFLRALAINPTGAYLYSDWGYSLASRGLYDEAVKNYAKAAELTPLDTSIYIKWGSALSRQQKYTEASEKYNKVLELDPRSSNAYNNLSTVSFHMQKYEETISHCSKAISITPTAVQSYFKWGLALYQLDRHEEAIEKHKAAKEEMANLFNYDWFKEQYIVKLNKAISSVKKRLEVETLEEDNIRHLQKHIDGMKQIRDVLEDKL